MERKLVMTFKDEGNGKFNLIVNSVKDDVTKEEINAIMDAVLSTEAIVGKGGLLVEKLHATVIDTTEEKYEV